MEPLVDYYAEQYQLKQPSFPAWFNDLQTQAFDAYLAKGLPTRKTEQWKYTKLDALKQKQFKQGLSRVRSESASHKVEVIDGTIAVPSTLPKGVQILKLSDALVEFESECRAVFTTKQNPDAHCFENLNLALLNEGLFVLVEKNVQLAEPIEILVKNKQAELSYHFHHVFYIEEGASVDIVEHFHGADEIAYFSNHISQLYLKANAKATHIKILEEGNAAYHISKNYTYQERDAELKCHSFVFNGGTVRSDLESDLQASGAHIAMNGLYLTSDTQHVAHYTRVNHLSPHATSDEFYKGILGGASQAVFNGTIHVAKDAQKTDASQQNKNLLLSSKAEIDTKPQLEIFADDVKCAHGATVGQLEENALFYLQTRGIAKTDAVALLVNAFAGDLIDQLDDKHRALKDYLHQRLEQKLRQAYAL